MSWTPTDEQARAKAERTACEHCPDGHARPESRPWGVFVASEVDGDGQPTHLYVAPTAGQHVAESDAEWARARLNEAATRTRVVTTVTELDALPVGSVVLDSGGWAWTHVDDTERLDEEGDRLRRAWACVAYRSDRTSAEMFHGSGRRGIGVGVGPFRVLYEPEETR